MQNGHASQWHPARERSGRSPGKRRAVDIIDQTALPHAYRVLRLAQPRGRGAAIRSMQVRGAPLIGVTAAYGLALALARRRR
jgi:methylthioribose-1-phosphate isomerase